MAREIELKIRLSDPLPFLHRLSAMAESLGPYAKQDSYFRGPGGTFRLRTTETDAVVCVKQKTIDGGIETSREIEFKVDSALSVEAFAGALGFRPWYRKTKNGQAWRWNSILIEEGQVSDIGWFAELEILLDEEAGPEAIDQARSALLAAVETLGASPDDIEPRTYAQLLGHKER